MTAAYEVNTQCRRYENRVAIVTGGAQGLGRAIVRRLAEEGARVMIADIQEDRAEQTARTIEADTGMEIRWCGGDLGEPGAAAEMLQSTLDAFGQVDTLVNNAAALIRMSLVDFDEDLMQKAVKWNVWNTLRCCKAVLPHMLSRGYGRIVNIAGEAWRTGTPYHTLLAGVGKGSMIGLTATLAGEVAAAGITVNCVSPAAIDTAAAGSPQAPTSFQESTWTPAEVAKALAALGAGTGVPIGRAAHPSEVAAVVAFFGAPESSYVTGQHIGASGGRAML